MSLVLLLTFAATPLPAGFDAGAGEEPWELVDDDDGIAVWSREVEGSEVDEVLARVVVKVPAERAWAVLNDVAHYHEFMPNMSEARILEQVGRRVSYLYQKVDAPLVSTREVIVRIELEEDPDEGRYVRNYRAANHPLAPPLDDDVVRMPRVEGLWAVRRIDARTSEMIYKAKTDPGGSIPAWIANRANRSVASDLMDAVRDRAIQLRKAP